MRFSIRVFLSLLGLAFLAQPAWAQQEFQTYKVEPGDTCTSIAAKFYGDARAYHHIHEHNDLSEYGYACQSGITLKLPVLPDQAEAEVIGRVGSVRAKRPEASWDPIDIGAELYTAWRVNTLEKSRADLGFRDSSQLKMTENTLVVIYGPSKTSAERTTMRRASVERGRLKTSLAGLSGQEFEVDTPEAVATMEKGKAQVTVDEDVSRIANHEGKPVAVTDKKGAGRVQVRQGQGTRVKKGQRPEKPRALPATPKWDEEFSPRALVVPGAQGTVQAKWEPVDGAEAYFIEVTRTRRQLDVVFSQRVPQNIHALQMQGLPAGNYYVSVVAIDKDEFESIPSELRRLRVLELAVSPESVVDAAESKVLLGSAMRAPVGMTCAAGEGEPAEIFTLDTLGAQEIRCASDAVELSAQVEVVPPQVELSDDAVTLAPGEFESVEVDFSPQPLAEVEADPEHGGIFAQVLGFEAGRLKIRLIATEEAPPGPSNINLFYKNVPLGNFEVTVDPKKPKRPVVEPAEEPRGEYLLSVLAGYDAGGVDPFWERSFPEHAAALELGLGTAPTRYFAGEARAGLALYPGDSAETMLTVRAQAMAGWFDAALAPHAGLGLSWFNRFGADNRFAPRASLGLMPELSPNWRLRAEIAADFTPVDGEIRFLPEARLGAAWRF